MYDRVVAVIGCGRSQPRMEILSFSEVVKEMRQNIEEPERGEEDMHETFLHSKPWQLVTACRPHKLVHKNVGYESLDNAAHAALAQAKGVRWDDVTMFQVREWLCERLRQNHVIIRWGGLVLNAEFQRCVLDKYSVGGAMDKGFVPRRRFWEVAEHNPTAIDYDLRKSPRDGAEEEKMELDKDLTPSYDLAKEILKKVGQCFANKQVCNCPRTMSHSVDGKGTAMMCLSEEKAMIHFTASAVALEKFAKSVQADYVEDLSNPCNPIIVGYVHWLMRLELSDDMDGSYECELKFPKKSDKRFQGFFAGYMWKKGG